LHNVLGGLPAPQHAPEKHFHPRPVRAVQRVKGASVAPANALPNVAIVRQSSSLYCYSCLETKTFLEPRLDSFGLPTIRPQAVRNS
jgi:hypothetical protein